MPEEVQCFLLCLYRQYAPSIAPNLTPIALSPIWWSHAWLCKRAKDTAPLWFSGGKTKILSFHLHCFSIFNFFLKAMVACLIMVAWHLFFLGLYFLVFFLVFVSWVLSNRLATLSITNWVALASSKFWKRNCDLSLMVLDWYCSFVFVHWCSLYDLDICSIQVHFYSSTFFVAALIHYWPDLVPNLELQIIRTIVNAAGIQQQASSATSLLLFYLHIIVPHRTVKFSFSFDVWMVFGCHFLHDVYYSCLFEFTCHHKLWITNLFILSMGNFVSCRLNCFSFRGGDG